MLIQEIMYGLKCDRCDHVYHECYTDFCYWTDEGTAWECAQEEGWVEIDGKRYCPCCYMEDEESGDMTPKPPYPQAFRDFRLNMCSILPRLEMYEDPKQCMRTTYNNHRKIPVQMIGELAALFGLSMEEKRTRVGSLLIFTLK